MHVNVNPTRTGPRRDGVSAWGGAKPRRLATVIDSGSAAAITPHSIPMKVIMKYIMWISHIMYFISSVMKRYEATYEWVFFIMKII